MHDPMTQAFVIPFPWFKRFSFRKDGSKGDRYWSPFITIWHVDPCNKGHGDDSCGWFMRAYHGDQAVREKIRKEFEYDWDRTFTLSKDEHDDEEDGPYLGTVYYQGYFYPVGTFGHHGENVMSIHATGLNLTFIAARIHFDSWKKADRFVKKNLHDILMFAENPHDSMADGFTRKFGVGTSTPYTKRDRDDRISATASMIYAWIIRKERPWWRHPRWHIHHWKLQIHPWQKFRRWVLSRCCKCGGRFAWGESPCTDQWDRSDPKFLRGEEGVYHQRCSNTSVVTDAQN